ncbi:MAG TPA: hypothetical protein VFX15_03245 [Actinomycetes bacterium]|nr:hypothetical protein [Actinomycetes bacterium]
MIDFEPIHTDHRASFVYYGAREGWLITLSVHRDSDTIERSNWDVIVPAILEAHPEDAAIERMNNWAVGWIDHLLVRPGSNAEHAMRAWAERLDRYPIADEEALGMLEWDEEWCVRCNSGTREQHRGLEGTSDGYICGKFRSENDADEIAYAWRHRRDFR